SLQIPLIAMASLYSVLIRDLANATTQQQLQPPFNETTQQLNLDQYGYIPTKAVTVIFVALYAISAIVHLGQAAKFRMWWLLPTAVLCGIGEIIGWSGRLWSSISPQLGTPFLIQISTTIIAPTPLLAATFVIFSRIIGRLGPAYSRVSPKTYTAIFIPCDVIALVVQGAGGGIASSANTPAGSKQGANIMLGGIVFQLVVIIFFSVFALDYLVHYVRDAPVRSADFQARGALTPRLRLMVSALGFSTLLLFIRSIYRTVELAGGWHGHVLRTQIYFNVLDGAMVFLAIYTLNAFHPGVLLAEPALAPEMRAASAETFEKPMLQAQSA
ncbi:unnamed protein product, partial [Mycena citricolor]